MRTMKRRDRRLERAHPPRHAMLSAAAARIRVFSVIAKPVGAACNLRCRYCYYLHKQSLLGQPAAPRMSLQVLEEHIRQTLESQPGPEVVFHWPGGEPTIAGLEFFREVVALQRRPPRPWHRVGHSLQTNGTLLDGRWAAFLAEKGFLVGLSLDGPRALHDTYRVTPADGSVFDPVLKAAQRLRRAGVAFHAMCVVNRANARRPLEVYRFLARELRPQAIQFIPACAPLGFERAAPGTVDAAAGAAVSTWSGEPTAWGRFLCAVWDDWLAHDYGRVFVDLFEDAVSISLGHGSQRCVSAERCGDALALEADGGLYSCDHFVHPAHRLGNITQAHQCELASSPRQRAFGDAKADTLPRACRECAHRALCGGDCPRNRFVPVPGEGVGISYLCAGHRMFFSHIASDLQAIGRRIARASGPAAPGA